MINVRMMTCGAYAENAYLVWDDERPDCVLIDPGDDLPAIEGALAASGKRLSHILLTHGHFDHTLACAPLREKYGAEVLIHPLDAHMLTEESASLMNRSVSRLPFMPLRDYKAYPSGPCFGLVAAGLTFEGIHTPGHTPGGVSLVLPAGRCVFTGDTLFAYGYGRYDFPGGDLYELMSSIRGLLALDGDYTVYSGHGEEDSLRSIARRWRTE
ncbi:MAG: MBL fold metallo-hydrolase [Clostridia bacterium]|nr:MBL fold metallo-hydrolase [Clostridia bacterium]